MRLDDEMKLAVMKEVRDSALRQMQLLEEILEQLRAAASARGGKTPQTR